MATIYANKDNGDLKLIGEADDDGTSPALLIDLLLDQETRLRERDFTVITPDGTFIVTVNGDEPVNPRRDIDVQQLGGATKSTKRNTRKAAPEPEPEDDDEEEEKPKTAPRRRAGRKPATKKAPARRSAAKSKAAPKPAGKKGSPFKRKPASDGD